MTPGRVLVVCTGNICRSPLAERLLQARLADRGVDLSDVVVASAGTRAVIGYPMDEVAADELARVGGDPAGHVARQLTSTIVGSADLIVTATLAHRSEVVTVHPPALRYAFGLLELVRLLEGADLSELPQSPADRVRGLARIARGRRGLAMAPDPRHEDVVDPYRRSARVYADATLQIVPGVDALARAVAGPG